MTRRRRTGVAIGTVLALAVAMGLRYTPAMGASSSPAATAAGPSTASSGGSPANGSPSRWPCAAVAGGPSPSVAPGTALPGGSSEASPTPSMEEDSLWETPSDTPLPPTIAPPSVPMAEAWGDVPVHSIDTDLGHDRRFVFAGAATSDGEWLVGASQPNGFSVEGKVTWGRSDAVLVRVSDGEVRRMARLTTPLSQLTFAASDGPWVVWMESDDNPYGYDWRLRVYDRDAGTTRELARAPHKDGAVLEGPWPVPWVSHDLAVWGQAVGPLTGDDPLRNAVVREADLRTGEVTTLARHAGLPAISWPWMAWGVGKGTDEYTLVTNRETGQRVRLDTKYHTLVLHGASAAYNTPDYHVVCLVDDLAAGATRPILSDPNIYYEWLTMNDRAVGFAQQSLDPDGELGEEPTQVYDRVLDALIDLPMQVGFSDTFAVGPLVVWQTPTKHWDDYPDLIRVVHTRDIAP